MGEAAMMYAIHEYVSGHAMWDRMCQLVPEIESGRLADWGVFIDAPWQLDTYGDIWLVPPGWLPCVPLTGESE